MLYYRKPGKSIVRKKGFFVKNDWKREGFIVSDHDGKNTWFFEESNEYLKEDVQEIWSSSLTITKQEYLEFGNKTLHEIRNTSLNKFVLSRIECTTFPKNKRLALFKSLCSSYPSAFVYYMEDKQLGTWIGASPEQLLSKKNNFYQTRAIAGTKLATDNNTWGIKEIEEQEYVTQFILEQLSQLKSENTKTKGPFTLDAGPIKHLCTEIDFEYPLHPKAVLKALHPTPAVLGYPFNESLDFRKKIEQHERALYSGYIGHYSDSFIDLYVNIRCCRLVNNHMYLYLGGGYTKDSIPEKEWQETENKKKTFTSLMNLL